MAEKPITLLSRVNSGVETLEGVFSYPLRVVSLRVSDSEGHTYLLQVGMSMRHVSTTLVNVTIRFFSPSVSCFILLISFSVTSS